MHRDYQTTVDGVRYVLRLDRATGATVLEPEAPRQDVLCGCGWGRLAVPADELPDTCPQCGHTF